MVAGLCGIATDYLSQIERGLRMPSSEVVGRLAAKIRVPASWLLADDDSPGARSSRVWRVTAWCVRCWVDIRSLPPPVCCASGWRLCGACGRRRPPGSPLPRRCCRA
ncbi:helix-turn-helix domain-containing protein [Streptomyces sp. NBC_00825]|uniref:helix-turn-helix domain-containing protein n=1 Tax=unclassified Streptomyces TaxID=2593676 RepID=UPI002ED46502|nr:helix-turn-helix domain-containing protein [Streptomyces sp. NBC_00826]WTH87840.1 helix-turn-helix domain-containing protein [Streptomyces sp. NBC_00825]WTH96567.1 helix-turn-helix domain-containing protein [Streptomyces sp. NBC_00822]